MIKYQDESAWGKFKRAIGIRDGYLICNKCKKDMFNLSPSEVCYFCWCDINGIEWDWH